MDNLKTPQESNTQRVAVNHQCGGCVTESIFNGTSIVPLADVQHIEKRGDGNIMVIMKSTSYAFEKDEWMNPVYFAKGEAQRFLTAWCGYRAELEASTLADISPANDQGEARSEAELPPSPCSLSAFVHTSPGHYIGSCAVVIASTEKEARELLKPAMEASGLGNEEIKFQAYELEPQIIHFADGDY